MEKTSGLDAAPARDDVVAVLVHEDHDPEHHHERQHGGEKAADQNGMPAITSMRCVTLREGFDPDLAHAPGGGVERHDRFKVVAGACAAASGPSFSSTCSTSTAMSRKPIARRERRRARPPWPR